MNEHTATDVPAPAPDATAPDAPETRADAASHQPPSEVEVAGPEVTAPEITSPEAVSSELGEADAPVSPSAEVAESTSEEPTPESEPEPLAAALTESPVNEPAEAAAVSESHESPDPVAPAELAAVAAVEPTEEESSKKAKKPRPAKKKAKAEGEEAESEPEPTEAAAEPAPEAELAPAEVTGEGADAPPAEAPPENKKKWYAIKVQSGREDTIKAAILRKVAIEHLEDVFPQILVPFEEVIEKKQVKVKDKKTGETGYQERKITRKRKKFQGYIFAEMEFNDRLLYLVRETSGVGDFLKLRPRPNDSPVPEPMTDAEVKQMLGEKVSAAPGKIKLDIEKGDRVKIKEGAFAGQEGEVKEIILPKDPTDPPKLIVIVTFWGQQVPVDVEYWHVTKV